MYQKINKLSESFGLEVIGISLTPDMPKSQINELEQLILEHKVVVFKNQNLTPEQQIKFCNQFGEIEP
ncbi:TauD/TfdA dioxygenase family protein, partial [Rickettsia tamurae]